MASSGSIKSDSYEGRYLQLSWTQTKDVANNKSTIKWTLSSIGGTEVYYSTGATTVKINGTQVYYKDRMDWSTYAFPAAKGSVSGTTTINHASDGTGSIKVELSTAIWYYAISSYSKTWTLDTIPRASTPTLSASSVNIGSAITINTNRASSAFTHKIRYKWNGTTTDLTSGVGDSYKWTVPTSLASGIPNATSGTVTIYLDTYNGSTLIGTKSVTFTAKVPNADWTKPKINSVTISPSGNLDWVGSRYVQSKTKARVVTGTAGQAGATIKSCVVTIDGTNYTGTDITSNILNNSGTVTATVVVTDSRGYTNTTTKNITVEAYSKPYISNHSTQSKIICARCNDSGTLVSNGTRLRIMVSKKWSALSGSINTAQVQYQIGTNSWVTASAHTVTASDIALTVTNITLDLKQTYKVNIKITDKFGTTDTYQYNIPTEEIAFNLREGGGGAAFGKYAEWEDFLDLNWNLYCRKNFSINTATFAPIAINRTDSANGAAIKFVNTNGTLGFVGMANEANSGLRRWTANSGTAYLVLDTGNTKDYVVEQGTSNYWTYRKWNSGIAECWKTVDTSTGAFSGTSPTFYSSPGTTYAYPTDLFTSVKSVQLTVAENNGAVLAVFNCSGTDATYCEPGYVRLYGGSTALTVKVSFFISGTWK